MNDIQRIIVIACLAGMAVAVVAMVTKAFTLNRADRLQYLKGFKRGRFAIIYFIAIPLYAVGIRYSSGGGIVPVLISSIKSTIEMVVLKYDYASVSALIEADALYKTAMYICFALVTVNAIIFTFTLCGRAIRNFTLCSLARFCKKVYVVMGYSEHNRNILNSVKRKDGRAVLFTTTVTENMRDAMFVDRRGFVKLSDDTDLGDKLLKFFKRFDKKQVNVIINTGDDTLNLIYTQQLARLIVDKDLGEYALDDAIGLDGYVFGSPANSSAFEGFLKITSGCIHYVNKYKLVAIDFENRYPLTRFMTDAHIDYSTATLRSNVEVNVVMLGFGKTNHQMFLTSVANNQFLTKQGDKLTEKAVKYWIYDKIDPQNDKNLNHNYFRYKNECLNSAAEGDYFPLSPLPAQVEFIKKDVKEADFYDSIRNSLQSRRQPELHGENGETPHESAAEGVIFSNSIIIAVADDLQNLDLANKLYAKLMEWGLTDNTRIFVKIRSDKLSKDVIGGEEGKAGRLKLFGNEKKLVYNIGQIADEKMEKMAKSRHFCYSMLDSEEEEANERNRVPTAYEMPVEPLPQKEKKKDRLRRATAKEEAIKKAAKKKWVQRWHKTQRESNIYAAAAIRMKLNLLGYDYCGRYDKGVDASRSYYADYERGDKIQVADGYVYCGKRLINYTNDYVVGSPRYTLAVQEHQRWLAYMITNGIIPSTKQQLHADVNGDLTREDSKNMELRRHSNVTTFDGLLEFRKLYVDEKIKKFNAVIDRMQGDSALSEKERAEYSELFKGITSGRKLTLAGESRYESAQKSLDEGVLTKAAAEIIMGYMQQKIANTTEETEDVIRYDYQLMDDVVWLLGTGGYKICRR